MEKFFKIGEISRLYQIGVDSLRYYEEIGLVHPKRSESGYRLYSSQELWKLNVIRDLRELGLSMPMIKEYLNSNSAEETINLLTKEKDLLKEKISHLEALRKNVENRIKTITEARNLLLNTILEKKIPLRNCYEHKKHYQNSYDMDWLMKELLNEDSANLHIIGSNQFGSTILRSQQNNETITYTSAFVIDPKGKQAIPGGNYLCAAYNGTYENTSIWLKQMEAYAVQHQLRLSDTALELLWMDIHTTPVESEFVTELQIRIL